MYYVYLLQSMEDLSLYIGFTQDLKRRLKEHNNRTSKYTKKSQWKLIYYEAYLSKKDALIREKRLKKDGRSKYHLKNRLSNSIGGKSK